MSNFFSFDRSGGGAGNFWNYHDPTKENYSAMLVGRLVELSDPPATKFQSREIERWEDGNPKRNIRMAIVDGAGNEFLWEFNPGSSSKPSQAMAACATALQNAGIQASGLEDMLGMVIMVSTQEPPQGFSYGQNAPRPWIVKIQDATVGEHRGTKHVIDPVTEGQQQASAPQAPAQQAQPMQAMPQQPMPQQPMVQPQVMQAAQQAANAIGFQQ